MLTQDNDTIQLDDTPVLNKIIITYDYKKAKYYLDAAIKLKSIFAAMGFITIS